MQDTQPLEPSEALDRFFAIVRQEAVRNPGFGARLLDALNVQVLYQGDVAAEVIDPVGLVGHGQEEFRKIFLGFDDKRLTKFLKDFDLASKTDIGRRKGPALVDLLWERASTKHEQLFGR